MEINPNIFPSNSGYSYREKDGSFHRSEGWGMLVNVVKAYRERNGLEVGDVRGDVMHQACLNNPSLCRENAPHQLVPSPTPHSTNYASTLFQKISNWLAGLVREHQRGAVRQVSRQEAERRAGICVRCPRHTPIPATCGSCHTQLQSFRHAILQGHSINQGLAGCSALGEDLQVSVHIEHVPVTVDGQPDHCWRKTG